MDVSVIDDDLRAGGDADSSVLKRRLLDGQLVKVGGGAV